jgi:hypothetical protein
LPDPWVSETLAMGHAKPTAGQIEFSSIFLKALKEIYLIALNIEFCVLFCIEKKREDFIYFTL